MLSKINSIRRGIRTRAHAPEDALPHEMNGGAIVCRDSSREPPRDEPVICCSAISLTVVVRACAAAQQSKPVVQCGEATERVRDRTVKPADHPGADAAQHNAAPPCFAHGNIDAMHAPDCQQVGRIAPADVNQILRQQDLCRIRTAPLASEKRRVRRPAAMLLKRAVKSLDVRARIPAGRRHEAHAASDHEPNGNRRTRWRESSTTTIAPLRNASAATLSTVSNRRTTNDVVVFLSLKRTTLTTLPRDSATISPKSKSNVITMRSSVAALLKISPFASLCKPSSRRCLASCPCCPISAKKCIVYADRTSSLVNQAAYSIAC